MIIAQILDLYDTVHTVDHGIHTGSNILSQHFRPTAEKRGGAPTCFDFRLSTLFSIRSFVPTA
jgi:hypothetical protein